MEFFEVIEKRHCCRSFDSNKKVDDTLINKIIDAGKKAPTAGGIHPVTIQIISDNLAKEVISATSTFNQKYLPDAPTLIVLYTNIEKSEERFGQRGRDFYAIQDAAAMAENIFLAATALGVATSWIGAFDEDKVGKILGLSENQRPVVIMPLGYCK